MFSSKLIVYGHWTDHENITWRQKHDTYSKVHHPSCTTDVHTGSERERRWFGDVSNCIRQVALSAHNTVKSVVFLPCVVLWETPLIQNTCSFSLEIWLVRHHLLTLMAFQKTSDLEYNAHVVWTTFMKHFCPLSSLTVSVFSIWKRAAWSFCKISPFVFLKERMTWG